VTCWRSERGAAAVEFALVVPILLALVLGIVEFGRAYNIQISLTHAAREAARSMAINNDWVDAQADGENAAPSLNGGAMDFRASLVSHGASSSATPAATSAQTSTATATPVSECTSGFMIEVSVEYPLDTITGIADDMVLEGKAAMRCGG
jgi:Flp pilus assembly protein TadG